MEERAYLKDIQQLISLQLPVAEGHPYEPTGIASTPVALQPPRGKRPAPAEGQRSKKPKHPNGGGNFSGGGSKRRRGSGNWGNQKKTSPVAGF
jgi:hypothetical protein